jgi:hypothetical protein
MMVVHRLEAARVRTRTFLVSYWPDLAATSGNEIKLGVFGDLRMGKRYALGLIARSTTEPAEIERVGRMARRLVEGPYKALRERYDEIWATSFPQDTFEHMLGRVQSSLIFSDVREQTETVAVADLKDDVEKARNWCMDRLRPVLRERFHTWMATTGAPDTEGRELLDERLEPQNEPLRLAVG